MQAAFSPLHRLLAQSWCVWGNALQADMNDSVADKSDNLEPT